MILYFFLPVPRRAVEQKRIIEHILLIPVRRPYTYTTVRVVVYKITFTTRNHDTVRHEDVVVLEIQKTVLVNS